VFQIIIDGIVQRAADSNSGCFKSFMFVNMFICADVIILIAPTLTELQCLLNVWESELVQLDIYINICKSMSIRL